MQLFEPHDPSFGKGTCLPELDKVDPPANPKCSVTLLAASYFLFQVHSLRLLPTLPLLSFNTITDFSYQGVQA